MIADQGYEEACRIVDQYNLQKFAVKTQNSQSNYGTQLPRDQFMGSAYARMQQSANTLSGLGQSAASRIYNDIPTKNRMEKGIDAYIKTEKKFPQNSKEKKHMFGFAKEYLDKHKDTVMTILVALFVDHFFLGGALREKIKGIVENSLDKAQKHLSATPALDAKNDAKSSA